MRSPPTRGLPRPRDLGCRTATVLSGRCPYPPGIVCDGSVCARSHRDAGASLIARLMAPLGLASSYPIGLCGGPLGAP